MDGAHSHGQGHETAFPQIVADMLGVDPDNVEIVHGDTSKIPFGMGTYGSRSLAVCGSAIVRGVEKIISKGKKIAGRYEIGGKKLYAKQILAEPETYFTDDVMQALDEIAQSEFSYGS